MRHGAAVLALALSWAATGAAPQSLAPDRSLVPIERPGGPPLRTALPAIPNPTLPATGAVTDADGLTRVVIRGTGLAPASSRRPVPRGGAFLDAAPIAATQLPVSPPPTTSDIARASGGVLARLLAEAESGGVGTDAALRPIGTELAVSRSVRPVLRPDGLEGRVRAAATRATPARVTELGTTGTVCGVPGLVGERLSPITGRLTGCGIQQPVRLRAVDGVALSTPATINCDTAEALQTWLRAGVVPAVGRRGGGVEGLRVVASYACRTRNSQAGARLSEHATGNAIDIAGIQLASGDEISVLDGWRDRTEGPMLEQMHRAACGPFGTVLGPESDRFHQDHFHFDVASYRSGPYCR